MTVEILDRQCTKVMSFLCSDLSRISIVLRSSPRVLWLIFKFARNCFNLITLYIYIYIYIFFFWFNFSMDVYWVHWCLCIYPYSTDFDDWLCTHMEWDLVQYNHRYWKWLLLLWHTCIALMLAEKFMLTLSFFFVRTSNAEETDNKCWFGGKCYEFLTWCTTFSW